MVVGGDGGGGGGGGVVVVVGGRPDGQTDNKETGGRCANSHPLSACTYVVDGLQRLPAVRKEAVAVERNVVFDVLQALVVDGAEAGVVAVTARERAAEEHALEQQQQHPVQRLERHEVVRRAAQHLQKVAERQSVRLGGRHADDGLWWVGG